MEEDRKKEEIAMFRYSVISPLIGYVKLRRGDREAIIRELCARQWEIPYSGRSYISRSTIMLWLRRYEGSGRRIESLYPEERKDKGSTRVIDEETEQGLINLKRQLGDITMEIFIKEAKQRGILSERSKVSKATLYRLFKRHGLNEQKEAPQDRRRFEAEYPNYLWQSDCMHGPMVMVEGKLKKSYLFAFIDDHSRLIPHAEFYLHERLSSYIDCLQKALSKRGLPRKLYVDNGPTFRSHQLSFACASLGIALIHSRPYQPEGRGKIERWFKTVRMQFLSLIPDGLSLEELNERLRVWIEQQYHQNQHSITSEAPIKRYLKHIDLIREAPENLRDYFRARTTRKVDRDRTVSLLGRVYEAPVELIGKTVSLFYHEDDPLRVEVFYNNKSYGFLTVLNPNINCRIRRRQGITEIIPDRTTQTLNTMIKGGMIFNTGGREDE